MLLYYVIRHARFFRFIVTENSFRASEGSVNFYIGTLYRNKTSVESTQIVVD